MKTCGEINQQQQSNDGQQRVRDKEEQQSQQDAIEDGKRRGK